MAKFLSAQLMRPNCFYDTFFTSHKALDKYNICAKNQYPPTLHREVTAI